MGIFVSGNIYRYARGDKGNRGNPELAEIDGVPNFYNVSHSPNKTRAQLEKGINQIKPTKGGSPDVRYPAILISSSPHSRGSNLNPWHDVFEPDVGYARYFGDNKDRESPERAGNGILLKELAFHTSGSRDERLTASPLLLFERDSKGYVRFHGLALIEGAELVTQFNPERGYFTNYVFSFAILSLKHESEQFDWSWIEARRSSETDQRETLELAPRSWRQWVQNGNVDAVRRRASVSLVVPESNQMPEPGSREARQLQIIYDFYEGKKHRFELLASRVVEGFLNSQGSNYSHGWVTTGSGDGGVDFVGKLRIGSGFAATNVVLLGQAKCEKLSTPTNGKDLARTVARLKRGWVGAYVTTSYFSPKSQAEIIEDSYPLLKISGLTLVTEALRLSEAKGFSSLREFLEDLDLSYEESVRKLRPEQVLEI